MTAVEPVSLRDIAESRLVVYSFLRVALNKPTPAQHRWMQQPEFQRALELLCDRFDVSCGQEEKVPGDYADFESRYIACFEAGLPAPPVPLQASCYNRREPVPAVIHEHILFYKRFGLPVSEDEKESADHLLNELAFLVHLDELVLTGKTAVSSICLARSDFLKRHPTRWLARAADDAEEKCLPQIYCTLLALLARAVEQDVELSGLSVTQHVKENQ